MKFNPYDFRGLPQNLIDIIDEITTAWNYSKYQNKVIIEGTPTWRGEEGEVAYCYFASSPGMFRLYNYIFINSSWRFTLAVGLT